MVRYEISNVAFLITAVFVTCVFLVSHGASSPKQTPEVFIRMTFNVAWARFCYLAPLFKHRLSDILVEERDGLVFLIPSSRIQIVNFEKECKVKHGNVKRAVVDFYIATHADLKKVDKKYTEHTFAILFHFWEARRMVLLGPTFELMVDNVEIKGEEAHQFPKRLNEAERLSIGIAIGLIITFALTALYIYLYHSGSKSRKTITLEAPRRHCKLVKGDSFTSKDTEDISLDDNVEGPSGLTEMVRIEPRNKGAAAPEQDDEEEEEEELNVFVTKV